MMIKNQGRAILFHNRHFVNMKPRKSNSIYLLHLNHYLCSCLLGDAQLSLCGNMNKQSSITDEIFNAHLVSFETFANNPAIINDPNLVVRIGGKYVILVRYLQSLSSSFRLDIIIGMLHQH